MILRMVFLGFAGLVLASCETTPSDGLNFKDRPYSTQGKVTNDYDYLI